MAPVAEAHSRRRAKPKEPALDRIIDAARAMFATRGYADTSLDDVVAAVGLTKGALYHHFRGGKSDLFEAVFEKEAHTLHLRVSDTVSKKRDPWQAAYAGVAAFLRCSQEEGIQKIILLDGPSVLGWEKTREIEGRYGLALIKASLQWLMQDGQIPKRQPDALAHLIFGAVSEGALLIARADDEDAARRKIQREIKLLIDGLAVK